MASRNLSSRQPAKNIGCNPPTRTVTLSNGDTRIEKVSPIKNNAKMVDPDGNVVLVSLATGYAIRDKENGYGPQVFAEKLAKGFIPYDECPVAKGYVTLTKKDAACPGSDGKGKHSRERCCHHVDAIIQKRRAKKQALENKLKLQYATQMDRFVEALKEQSRGSLNQPEAEKGTSPLAG